jgi:UDP-N-acetylglucosamine 2-epimerase (non-hydrolysing)
MLPGVVDGDDHVDVGSARRRSELKHTSTLPAWLHGADGPGAARLDSPDVKVISVVGARPQFVKLAPIAKAAAAAGVEHVIVHTGQHYDPMLSDVFFEDLGIPAPDVHLGVGSGSHGVQTGAMLGALDAVFYEHDPDWVLVYGDTNSTLAAAVSAVKLHYPLAHLEAGLRSFNRRMPEEHNRVLTDHAADLCLAPTAVAMGHLANEGLAGRSLHVGDVMTDVLLQVRDSVAGAESELVAELGLAPGGFHVATIHRAENTDDPTRLAEIAAALSSLDHPVVLLAHPRVVAKAATHGIELTRGSLVAHAPLAYPDLIAAVLSSRSVITDSGGLQKEAFLLRVPCTTVRPETEWVETVELGWNVLANTASEIAAAVSRPAPQPTDAAPYGDGRAAERVIETLLARARA